MTTEELPRMMVRVVRKKLNPGVKQMGRTAIRTFEVVLDGEVVGTLTGVTHYAMHLPLDGLATIELHLVSFDEAFEE